MIENYIEEYTIYICKIMGITDAPTGKEELIMPNNGIESFEHQSLLWIKVWKKNI